MKVPVFRNLNAQQHNRFRAAISKLVAYRSSTTAHTRPEEKLPELKAVEAVINPQYLSEETRIRYTEILAEHFGEDGYQTGRPIFRGRFRRFYAEKYGCPPAETDDRIDEIMSMVGTKRDNRVFPKQDDSQNDLIMEIVSDILSAFDSGATAVYIEAVYDKYQQPLADYLHIYNQDALASLLMAHANGKYTQRYSFLTNNWSGANAQEDLLRIMKMFHQPKDYAAIHEKAWFLPYERMKTILVITLKGKELSMADVFTEFVKDHEVLSVDELSALSDEMSTVIYWDSVLSEMIRISATELLRKDQIKFDVEAIDEILDGMCPGDYVPLSEINLFLCFPNIGHPWNSYLLESYLFGFSKKFRLLHSSFIKTGVYGAMVRKDADFQDYRALLVDVLSKSNALDSTKDALQYIVDKGYQQRRRYEGIETVIQEAKLVKEQREKQEK